MVESTDKRAAGGEGQRKLAQHGPWYEIKAETGTSKPRPWIAGPRFSQPELGGKPAMGHPQHRRHQWKGQRTTTARSLSCQVRQDGIRV